MFPTEEERWLVIFSDFFFLVQEEYEKKAEIFVQKEKAEIWKWNEKEFGDEMFLKKTRK